MIGIQTTRPRCIRRGEHSPTISSWTTLQLQQVALSWRLSLYMPLFIPVNLHVRRSADHGKLGTLAAIVKLSYAGDTRFRNWYPEIVTRHLHGKFDASSSQLLAITLQGSCHIPHSFCDGIALCSAPCRKLLLKNLYQIDRHTRKFLVPDDWYHSVSGACVTGFSFYRAMHFSAKRGIAIACRLSVCLSVCLSVTLVI